MKGQHEYPLSAMPLPTCDKIYHLYARTLPRIKANLPPCQNIDNDMLTPFLTIFQKAKDLYAYPKCLTILK